MSFEISSRSFLMSPHKKVPFSNISICVLSSLNMISALTKLNTSVARYWILCWRTPRNESKDSILHANRPGSQTRNCWSNASWSSRTQSPLTWIWRLSCAAINGKYMHIMVWSCPDMGYATTCSVRYTPVPSRVTYNRTNRIKRYLYYYLHRPFMYPQIPLHCFHIIRNNYDTPYFAKIKTTNQIDVFPDADHVGNQQTQRYLSSILVGPVGVAVDCKME